MIHYHGTPIGGTRDEAARFIAGRHLFVSWLRPEDMGPVVELGASFAIDNGAFTAWKQGKPISDWSDYFRFVAQYSRCPGFDFAIIPDEIEGDEKANDRLIAQAVKATEFDRVEWVPVWHFHESLERLKRLSQWRRVALGSSGNWPNPGTESWWRRLTEAMAVLCDDNGAPRCKIHGLRMLNPEIVSKVPFASADSTNVAQNGQALRRFGMYTPATQSQRNAVLADRIEATNSPPVWTPVRQAELELI